MSELPQSRLARLQYFEAHYGLWQTNAVNVGISAATALSVKNATTACRAGFDSMMVARNAAKAATLNFYNLNNTLVDLGRGVISTIKSFAESTSNPNVYVLADINPPAPPSPVPAPSTPLEFTGSVSPDGVVTLAWRPESSGPSSGVFFLLERKKIGEANYSVLGATMERNYMDPDADIGSGPVQYRVRAVRGNLTSAWTQPIVFNFGGGGGGGFTVSAVAEDGGGVKMAA
ncbi:MAG: hypothetical protein IT438_13230 [Phycisphaerales bacterium]|nr:hypothetical protein [Phycisphaerales bacterium]